LNKPEDKRCCFACSVTGVVVVAAVAVCIVVVDGVDVAATVVVVDGDGVVVAVIVQLTVDKNKLDASYEEGDIGCVQDAFDGKNP